MELGQRIRQLTKIAVTSVLQVSGTLTLLRSRLMRHKAAILMYHRIADRQEAQFDYSPNGMITLPSLFARQMRFLAKHYQVLTINQLCDVLEGTSPIPARPIACVTFDDGWLDNWTEALPVLRRYRIPATIFVSCNCIDNISWYWLERLKFVIAHAHRCLVDRTLSGPDRLTLEKNMRMLGLDALCHELAPNLGAMLLQLARQIAHDGENEQRQWQAWTEELAEYSRLAEMQYFMTWDQLRSLQNQGIEIGAHSLTHTDLTTLSHQQVTREIEGSKSRLESQLQRTIHNFAFPYGKHNSTTEEVLRTAGFRSASTTVIGLVDIQAKPFLLERINIHTDVSPTTAMFANRVLAQ
jgi:peptidoglycan/xylan/chitin deacetylase (PgdA/CDA1 family)